MVVPMTVLMMNIIPENIEASMFAVITATLTFSTDWAGDMIGGMYCDFFGVTTENLDNFHKVVITKAISIFIGIFLCYVLVPRNEEV